MNFLVTGGAGFIGSAVCRHLIAETSHSVVNLDALTYAASLSSLDAIAGHPRYRFVKGDIGDAALVASPLDEHAIDIGIHLAAESHVDRSIDGPAAFIQTNVVGTYTLLEAARAYHAALPAERRGRFRFHHVSTDEVFGQLPLGGGLFTEDSPYAPSSPYSASKAASDHFVSAWHHTYGLPVVLSNCSNNYGSNHFSEKLIPLAIVNGIEARALLSVMKVTATEVSKSGIVVPAKRLTSLPGSHSLETSTAKLHDSQAWDEFLHGEETSVCGGKGYVSAEREATFKEPGKVWGVMRKAPKGSDLHPIDARINRIIAMVRAKVEHLFQIIKRQFSQVKTRYRGLAKNRAQLFTLFAFGNPFLVRRRLMA